MLSPGGKKMSEDSSPAYNADWHMKYNRRLACFSKAASAMLYSPDGRFLLAGTTSGALKVWETSRWSSVGEVAAIRGAPSALAVSPGQRWLVVSHSTTLSVFRCQAPWQSAGTVRAPGAEETAAPWKYIAFSPSDEVDDALGKTGQDNYLAAVSRDSLCVFDYSTGWGAETKSRSRSLLRGDAPRGLCYTSCSRWIVCAFAAGYLQVWSAASLTLERTLMAHSETIHCIATSPKDSSYCPHLITCEADQKLHVWKCDNWLHEFAAHDLGCGHAGFLSCAFAAAGDTFVSVAEEVSVWRVVMAWTNQGCSCGRSCKSGRFTLVLHQRVEHVAKVDNRLVAAFCGSGNAIATSSGDGTLDLWLKTDGPPAEVLPAVIEMETPKHARQQQSGSRRPTAADDRSTSSSRRPMLPVSPELAKSALSASQVRFGSFLGRSRMASVGSSGTCQFRSPSSSNSAIRGCGLLVGLKPVSRNMRAVDPRGQGQDVLAQTSTSTRPFLRQSTSSGAMERQPAAFSGALPCGSEARVRSSSGLREAAGLPALDSAPTTTPATYNVDRQRLLQLRGGLVQRIVTDPKVITKVALQG
eukprot:TRINITY_DN30932_c0_g2_i1.p1 TRINITY_DN30932_c0_g2~~TRINITY_DN30932_c0_g2_i1.p1  ORF type:complete len:583 (+),score=79.88 TRINITY_DN30932_c0_g2_i1:111-1859(+)